jgi:hypothetical protein
MRWSKYETVPGSRNRTPRHYTARAPLGSGLDPVRFFFFFFCVRLIRARLIPSGARDPLLTIIGAELF